MAGDYWDRYWNRRANRRRFLGTAGAAGAGAAGLALVGCGDDDSTSGGGLSGLATPTAGAAVSPTAVDPFATAKRGGGLNWGNSGDPPTLDPFGNVSFLTKEHAATVYSRLFKYKTGDSVPSAQVRPTGDLAESAENSPDQLKWTVKLRKDVKFQNIAPVNGRAVTSDDVKFSFGRATAPTNGNAALLSFIDKVEYPDATTIVFSLKSPNVVMMDSLADTNTLIVMPTEADGKFDPAKTSVGSGPWIMDSYTPSQSFKYKKNPDWHVKGFPLFDTYNQSIIPDYSNRLAQFLAKNLDIGDPAAQDLVDVKKQLPDVQLFGVVAQLTSYIYFDSDPASPWNKDERVRQAISMSLDRDGLTDLGYQTKALKAAGIDVKGPWNNLIPAGMLRFWLDPQGKDQGDTAQFFKYDPANAKKLLSAAGFADGAINATYQYTANRYGKTFNDIAEANIAFINAIGVKTTTEVQDYSSKYFTQTFVGNFKGIAFGYETPFPEGGNYPTRLFTDNPTNHSKITKDQTLLKLTADQQKEGNEEKRKQIFWDIQRENAKHMYYIPNQAGAGTGWGSGQGNLKNYTVYLSPGYGFPTEAFPYLWKA